MNDRERIIDLVSYSSSHHAQRGKPRRGFDLRLHLFPFGNVDSSSHQPDHVAMLIQDWPLIGGNVAHGTVRTNNSKFNGFVGLSLDRALVVRLDFWVLVMRDPPRKLPPGHGNYSRYTKDL